MLSSTPGTLQDTSRRPLHVAREDGPARVVEQPDLADEQVAVGREVRLGSPDVSPVARHAVLVHRSAVDQSRQQMVAEVAETRPARLVRRKLAVQCLQRLDEHGRPVDEHLRRADAGTGTLRLVLETGDSAQPIGGDDRVLAGLRDGHDTRDDGAVGVLLPVGGERLGVVEPVDVVCAQDEQRLRLVLPDEVALAEQHVGVAAGEPVLHRANALLRCEDSQPSAGAIEVPWAPVGDLVTDRVRLVLHREQHIVDAGVVQVRQREVEQPVDPREWHRRLGALAGQPSMRLP